MSKTAIISDIHGHLAGLIDVWDEIQQAGCERVICLGDLVDGGAYSEEVVRFVRDHRTPTVQGNHDCVNSAILSAEANEYLRNLPEYLIEGHILFTHITPRIKKTRL